MASFSAIIPATLNPTDTGKTSTTTPPPTGVPGGTSSTTSSTTKIGPVKVSTPLALAVGIGLAFVLAETRAAPLVVAILSAGIVYQVMQIV